MCYMDTTAGLLVESACMWDFCFLSNSKFKASNFQAPWHLMTDSVFEENQSSVVNYFKVIEIV